MTDRQRQGWALFVVTSVVAMALIGPARVSAAERVLWAKHHTYYVWDKNKQAKAWGTASDRMSTACHRGEETRSALGHVRLPGTFLKSVKFIAQHWPTIYRVSGFDDSCAIAQKLFRVQLAIGSFDNFCEVVDSCHLQFTVVEQGTKQVVSLAPDICRWKIGVSSLFPPTAVIKAPCF
jgi:hypothetical protein